MSIGIQFKIKRLFKIISLSLFLFYISCTTAPKITYEGEREKGEYHGIGTITYPNGEKWEGEFIDGKPYNGQGTYTFPDGEKYVGELKDGNFHGQGTYTIPIGSGMVAKYVGDFIDGKYDGQGTFTVPQGLKLLSEFKDGRNEVCIRMRLIIF